MSGITPIRGERSSFLEPKEQAEYFGIRDTGLSASRGNEQPLFTCGNSSKKRQRKGSEYGEVPVVAEESSLSNAQIQKLQRQTASLKRQLEEQQLLAKRTEQKFLSDLKKERLKVEHKQSEVKRLTQDEEETRAKMRSMELEFIEEKHKHSDHVSKLERALREKESGHQEDKQMLNEAIKELEGQLEYAQDVAQEKQSQIEEINQSKLKSSARNSSDQGTKQLTEQLQNRLDLLAQENEDLRLQMDALEHGAAIGGRARELNEDLTISRRREHHLRQELRQCENEIDRGREDTQRAQALEVKLKHAMETCDRLVTVETERDTLLAEKREYAKLFARFQSKTKSSQPYTPMHALDMMLRLQDEHELNCKKKAELQIKLNKLKQELSRASGEILNLGKVKLSLEEKCAQSEENVEHLGRQCQFLEREREALLRVIDSVKDEKYATLPKAQQKDATIQELKSQQETEINELRKNLNDAHSRIKQLQDAEKGQIRDGVSPAILRTKSMHLQAQEKRIETLEAEKQKLTEELDKALDKASELEHHVASGMYNPTKTKILHLAMNPERAALGRDTSVSKLEALEAENAQLRAELNRGNNSSGLTGGDPNKRSERLKQVFKEKTRAFKEAVYLLTGYKIDMMDKESKPQLRLRSMYAEKPDDELIFQWNTNGGGLELLETSFCNELDENTFAYLTKMNAVPAFLANLTLDLFGKQTLAIG
eukprot:CAMPEP_0203754064 /NCGR_PEP_ID=MMETSP0098-20131031/7720_1 /ASSEMBLY_ACC=CAM_ASM_000208 /TAXON_ID=96639 /ORGANISM=" , Strain NY0313808BC1" /LENGTH=712 /DNA_ID=CAMNT_0050644917 /DNA_START=224 /DNA_END=2359 /DNA_ORIENTATION=-